MQKQHADNCYQGQAPRKARQDRFNNTVKVCSVEVGTPAALVFCLLRLSLWASQHTTANNSNNNPVRAGKDLPLPGFPKDFKGSADSLSTNGC